MRRRSLLALAVLLALTAPLAAGRVDHERDADASTVGFETDFGPDLITGSFPLETADPLLDFDDVAHCSVPVALILTRLLWHLASPPPHPMLLPARSVHWSFCLVLIAAPLVGWSAGRLVGWAGSSATGIDVMIADRRVVPPLVEASREAEDFRFAVHGNLTKLPIGLVLLHVAGAVRRALAGDGTLRRMIRGRA